MRRLRNRFEASIQGAAKVLRGNHVLLNKRAILAQGPYHANQDSEENITFLQRLKLKFARIGQNRLLSFKVSQILPSALISRSHLISVAI